MANHLVAFRKMQQTFKPLSDAEQKLPPSRPYCMINMRKYDKRTRLIMAKAMEKKPIPSMICHLEDAAFFNWRLTRNQQQSQDQQWLLDLDEMEGKPLPYQQLSIKLDFEPKCHCCSM